MTNPPENPLSGIPGATSWTPQGSAGNPLSFEKPAPEAPAVPSAPGPLPTSNAQFELAGWGARFGAWLIDTFLRLGIAYLITAVIFVVFVDRPFHFDTTAFENFSDESDPDLSFYGSDLNLIWFLVAGFFMHYALAFIYAPLFMSIWNGATPGKRAVGIRVVRQDGREVGFGMAFVREPLVKGIVMTGFGGSFFFPWILNYLWPLWDRECRAWHDMMCSTRVVKA